jgi:hypothetical protein
MQYNPVTLCRDLRMKVLLTSNDFSIQLKDTPAMISRLKDVESTAEKA